MKRAPAGTIPRLAIYARQSVDEDQGILQQVEDCQTEASRRQWPIVAQFIDNDTGASKARGSNTGWAAMLRAFDSGEFDTLMVVATARLTRNLTDVLDIGPPKRDIRVITVREGIDTRCEWHRSVHCRWQPEARLDGLRQHDDRRLRRPRCSCRCAAHGRCAPPPRIARERPGAQRTNERSRCVRQWGRSL